MYRKRNNIGSFWPVPKKGTKYVAMSTHNQNESIPLVVIARDILKLVRNKKELKKILNQKDIMINQKEIREVNYPVSILDIITFKNMNKSYRAELSKKKKMIFLEVKDKEAYKKIYKINNKTVLNKNKIQLNLMHGRTIMSDQKAKTGDSAVINLKDNKLEKIIPLEKGRKVFVIFGKHAGFYGKIEEIVERGSKKVAKLSSENQRLNVWTKNLIAIE